DTSVAADPVAGTSQCPAVKPIVAATQTAAAVRNERRRGRAKRSGPLPKTRCRATCLAVSSGRGNVAGTSRSRRSKSLGTKLLQLLPQRAARAAQARDDGSDRDLEVCSDLVDARIEPVVQDNDEPLALRQFADRRDELVEH